jgi:hypothetical protein
MFIAAASLATSFSGFEYDSKYACTVCKDLRTLLLQDGSTNHCETYGSCDVLNSSSVANGCDTFCDTGIKINARGSNSTLDIRVAKGFGTKSYGSLRVSVITQDNSNPTVNGQPFDYSAPFKYRWTKNQLHSSVIDVAKNTTSVNIAGQTVNLHLPAQGTGVAGVLIADPCVSGSEVGCTYEKKFQTTKRLPPLLNAFVGGSAATDFWGIFGDNFYDRQGDVTKGVYDQIDIATKSKIMLTVPGNHDYWVLGAPAVGAAADQYANGHMQWYAQDAKSAQASETSSDHVPFDFSVEPGRAIDKKKDLPTLSNSFFYNQIGNVGVIGYSGAYTFTEATPYFKEACAWLGDQDPTKMKMGVIVGHWDVSGLGCDSDMAGPALYEEVSKFPGCDTFDQKGMLKFVMGHTHCNVPHPHGKVDTGFMVAGQGMEGCGNFGIPIIDTTEDRVRFWHFEIVSKEGKDNYDAIMQCVQSKPNGWRDCTDLAESWLDQPLK